MQILKVYNPQNKMVARVGRKGQSRSREQLRQIWNSLAGGEFPAYACNHFILETEFFFYYTKHILVSVWYY